MTESSCGPVTCNSVVTKSSRTSATGRGRSSVRWGAMTRSPGIKVLLAVSDRRERPTSYAAKHLVDQFIAIPLCQRRIAQQQSEKDRVEDGIDEQFGVGVGGKLTAGLASLYVRDSGS